MRPTFERTSLLLTLVFSTGACATAGTSTTADAGIGDDSSSPADDAALSDGRSSDDRTVSSPDGGGPTPDGGAHPSDGSTVPTPDASDASQGGGPDSGGCGPAAPAIVNDFESASPLAAWQVTDPFGNPIPQGSTQYSVTIDNTTPAHSGSHSVKVHNGGLIGITPPGPAFYGRAWMRFGSSPGPVPTGGHWGSIIGVGPADSGQPVEVRMGGQFGILIDNYSSNDDVVLSDPNFFNDGMDGGTTPIVGTWTCLEFYFGKDSLRTWVNGSEITSLNVTPSTVWAHGMTAPWSPAYSSIRIGYANYNAASLDVWYDDVAIDTTRLCCP